MSELTAEAAIPQKFSILETGGKLADILKKANARRIGKAATAAIQDYLKVELLYESSAAVGCREEVCQYWYEELRSLHSLVFRYLGKIEAEDDIKAVLDAAKVHLENKHAFESAVANEIISEGPVIGKGKHVAEISNKWRQEVLMSRQNLYEALYELVTHKNLR